ncbi:PLP-dependent aminotransferase family protein [Rhizobium mongolense]|uniref:aminotransferase class III-fold pyridoxal phosphate-dependent enzyme n=1 Tax=Rhizobium mongolense TaxID=57676 RepID=UPI0011A56456
MLSAVTGHERITSAIPGRGGDGAMRLARAVTGRDRIVVFSNDYHGQFDESWSKAKPADNPSQYRSPPESLPFRFQHDRLALLRARKPRIHPLKRPRHRGVIIEPVQSRTLSCARRIVRELRSIATQYEFALVFDEVVTVSESTPAHASVWAIKATWQPMARSLAGHACRNPGRNSRFMDALDGGPGTMATTRFLSLRRHFCRNVCPSPCRTCAVRAVLEHIQVSGRPLMAASPNAPRHSSRK